MQPVPVQRSRMRRLRGGFEDGEVRRNARCVVMFSVSSLSRSHSVITNIEVNLQHTTHLGIKTPFLHNTSNPPNGWDPSIYCNGFPRARSRHMR